MSNVIQHHGVLGMKWGVRRYQPYPDGHSAGREIGKAAKARKSAIKEKRSDLKNRSILSDEQLRQKINRLQMEKQLRELTDSEVNSGRNFVQSVLRDAGKKALTTALTGASLYDGKALVTGSFDAQEFGNAIFNGGAKKK